MNPDVFYQSNDLENSEQDHTDYVLYKDLDLFPREHIYGLLMDSEHTYEKLHTDTDSKHDTVSDESIVLYTVHLNDAFYKSCTDYAMAKMCAYKKIQKIADLLHVPYTIKIKKDVYKLKVNGLEISRVTITQ
jgi:hypothetical protein